MNEAIAVLEKDINWKKDQLAKFNSNLVDAKYELDKAQQKVDDSQAELESLEKQLAIIKNI